MSGWFAADREEWEIDLETRARPLKWHTVRIDLRHLENEARVGGTFPTRHALMERWGWTEKQVRVILAKDDWHDPERPVDTLTITRSRRAPFQRESKGPSEGPVKGPAEGPADNDATYTIQEPMASQGPSEGPSEGPHARSIPEPLNHEPDPAPPEAGPDPVQQVWEAIVELEPLVQSRNGKPRAPQEAMIRARIEAETIEDVLLVVEYVHRRPHLDKFWGPTNKDPGSYMRPAHFPGILLRAKACGLSSVPRKPKLAWSLPSDPAFLAWVEDTAAPALLEVDDFAKGWAWWQEHVETDRADVLAYEHDQCWNAAWDARVAMKRQNRTLRLA